VGAASLAIPRANVIGPGSGFPTVGQTAMVAIRPEQVELSGCRREGQTNLVEGSLQSALFLGDRYEYTVTLGSETRVLVSPESRGLKSGDKVFLELKPEGMTLWPAEK
jgi:ABC-type Fe3+/spermidine/putrescine transport system ATPase subunit